MCYAYWLSSREAYRCCSRHKDKIFFVSSSKKYLWFDEERGEHKDMHDMQCC